MVQTMSNDGFSSPITLPRYYEPTNRSKRVQLDAALSTDAPRVPWNVFLQRFYWEQGEHIGLIGRTGSGKTNLLQHLLPLRTYVAIASLKRHDESMDRIIASGYEKFTRWPGPFAEVGAPRRVIWPSGSKSIKESIRQEQTIFEQMWNAALDEGGWTLVSDEGAIFKEKYNMEPELKEVWFSGRSSHVSQVIATQRPSGVPLAIYTQSDHLFYWQMNDERDLDRAAGTNSVNKPLMREILKTLAQFEVLYVNAQTGKMMRTIPPYLNQGGE